MVYRRWWPSMISRTWLVVMASSPQPKELSWIRLISGWAAAWFTMLSSSLGVSMWYTESSDTMARL